MRVHLQHQVIRTKYEQSKKRKTEGGKMFGFLVICVINSIYLY